MMARIHVVHCDYSRLEDCFWRAPVLGRAARAYVLHPACLVGGPAQGCFLICLRGRLHTLRLCGALSGKLNVTCVLKLLAVAADGQPGASSSQRVPEPEIGMLSG